MQEQWIRLALDTGFTQAGVIPVEHILFEEEIRRICAGNGCRNYGKSWACPPAVGTVEECRARCRQFSSMLLLSRRYEIEDSFDFEGMMEAGRQFKQLMDRMDAEVKKLAKPVLILSNEGCIRCEACTYPHAPCRYPDRLHHALEGYGLNVSQLASMAGMQYMGGPNTVTYFGAVLF